MEDNSLDAMNGEVSYAYQDNDYYYSNSYSVEPPTLASIWSLGGVVEPTAAPTTQPTQGMDNAIDDCKFLLWLML
jgi:hypothetical protein